MTPEQQAAFNARRVKQNAETKRKTEKNRHRRPVKSKQISGNEISFKDLI